MVAKPPMSAAVLPLLLLLLLSHLMVAILAKDYGVEMHGCFDKERKALVRLKQSLRDRGGMLSSWSGVHCCGWKGVGCDNSTGHVIKLDLRYNNKSDYGGYWALGGSRFLSTIWKTMPGLRVLLLSGNNLSGNIPTSLCDKHDGIGSIDLSTNHFSGEIPKCLVTSVAVKLNLANNSLNGTFSTSNSHFCNLRSLHLENNNLSGTLPLSLRKCIHMAVLDVGHNKFTGNVPTWLVENYSLKIIRLRSNMFFGSIPPQFSNLNKLQIIDMANNDLSGNIPPNFGNFGALKSPSALDSYLYNTADNDLYHGNIFDVGFWMGITLLDVFSDMGDEILIVTKGGEMTYVQTTLVLFTSIDLSGNRLSGEIPRGLGNLLGLRSLNLSGNTLIGCLPDTISGLKVLETLDLSRNYLSGEIPQNMSAMTSLSNLNLSFNRLSGRIPSGSQFLTFTNSSYVGNINLCGFPLQSCESGSSLPKVSILDEDQEDHEILWIYVSTTFGFIIGFWAFLGTLFFKKTWRYTYFQFIRDVNDMLYVRIHILIRKTST